MNKIIRCISLFTLFFLIGFFYTHLVYIDFIHTIKVGLSFYPWYIHILFIIITFQLGITLHELGHFISAKKHGIEVKAFYAGIFVFVKRDDKWKFSLMPKFAKMMGGLVMPVFNDVTSKDKYEVLLTKVQKLIKAGPQTSLYFGISTTLLMLVSFIVKNPAFVGVMFIVGIVNILLTILVMIASSFSKQGLYGDFVASKKLKQDKVFALSYVVSGLNFSKTEQESLKFLWPEIIDVLEHRYPLSNTQTMSLFSAYLNAVTFDNQIGCTNIDEKIKRFIDTLPDNEEKYQLICEMILFTYKNCDREIAIARFHRLKEQDEKIDIKVKDYWHHFIEHVTGINNHMNYLSQVKNINPTSINWIFSPILKGESFPIYSILNE